MLAVSTRVLLGAMPARPGRGARPPSWDGVAACEQIRMAGIGSGRCFEPAGWSVSNVGLAGHPPNRDREAQSESESAEPPDASEKLKVSCTSPVEGETDGHVVRDQKDSGTLCAKHTQVNFETAKQGSSFENQDVVMPELPRLSEHDSPLVRPEPVEIELRECMISCPCH